jgi:hypothetical protein
VCHSEKRPQCQFLERNFDFTNARIASAPRQQHRGNVSFRERIATPRRAGAAKIDTRPRSVLQPGFLTHR